MCLQALSHEEQVDLARRCGWLNVTPLTRRDYVHLHGLFFCLRLGREEESRLARRLASIAVETPTQTHPCFFNLRINGAPAAINEDERFFSTIMMFCANRKLPDPSWDSVGTLEFTLKLPAKSIKHHAAVSIQAAFRGFLCRQKVIGLVDATAD
jgi:hypothetical protein